MALFYEINDQEQILVNKAVEILTPMEPQLHCLAHIECVLGYLSRIYLSDFADKNILIVAAYWHDIGKTVSDLGHEQLSADMLSDQMRILGFEESFITKCADAVKFHKWSMKPTTAAGKLLRDADLLTWLSIERWKDFFEEENKNSFDTIMELLPTLRSELVYDSSKKIFDEEIVKLTRFLYDISSKYSKEKIENAAKLLERLEYDSREKNSTGFKKIFKK